MSLKAEVTLTWGDGTYPFALKGAQIEELERQCGKIGIGAIFQRIALGTYFWRDVRETIRLGLIGGGMGAVEALRKVDTYIDAPVEAGPNSPVMVAKAVLGAVFVGLEHISPGEPLAGE